jgi:hypothetical protein
MILHRERYTEYVFTEHEEIAELDALMADEMSKYPWLPEKIARITNRIREGRSLEKPQAYRDWPFLSGALGEENAAAFMPCPKPDGEENALSWLSLLRS